MARRQQLDWDSIHSLDISQKRQQLPRLAKLANSSLYNLRAKKVDYYATELANTFLQEQNRRSFPTTTNRLTNAQVNEYISNIERFLRSKSSTLSGLREIEVERVRTLNAKGYNNITVDNWRKFTRTKQFKTLSRFADSETVIEDFNTALDEGDSLSEIMESYNEFLNSQNMTFEQIEERRRIGRGQEPLY